MLCLMFVHGFILSDQMYYEALGEQVSYERISQMLQKQKERWWLPMVFTPIIYALKFCFISFFFLVGAIFHNYKISFKRFYQVSIQAEFIFLLPVIFKFFYFLLIAKEFGLQEVGSFNPYSLLYYLKDAEISHYIAYPLYLINVFEIGYWFILAYLLNVSYKVKFLIFRYLCDFKLSISYKLTC